MADCKFYCSLEIYTSKKQSVKILYWIEEQDVRVIKEYSLNVFSDVDIIQLSIMDIDKLIEFKGLFLND